MADPVDYTDPCAVLAVLRPAYYALLGGSNVETVEYSSGAGETKRVTYNRTKLDVIQAEVRRLEQLCAAKTSGKATRFAITPGGNGGCFPWRRS